MESVSDITLLGRIYKLSQIFALVGTPIVVAVLGWKAQASAVEISTSQDYVQLAMQVLKEPLQEDRHASRAWAIGIIQKYSPVAFSPEAGRELSKGAIAMLASNPLLKPAMEERPPCKRVDIKSLPQPLALEVATLYAQCANNQKDLMWLRTYVHMITAEDNESLKSSAGLQATP
jgi:hypothetical protein